MKLIQQGKREPLADTQNISFRYNRDLNLVAMTLPGDVNYLLTCSNEEWAAVESAINKAIGLTPVYTAEAHRQRISAAIVAALTHEYDLTEPVSDDALDKAVEAYSALQGLRSTP